MLTHIITKVKNVYNKYFTSTVKVDHPLMVDVIRSLWSQCTIQWSQDQNILIKIFYILIKVSITIEYLLLYFYAYTTFGKYLIRISCVVCINYHESVPLLIVYFLYLNIVIYLAITISFYIYMQVPFIRVALISVIGTPVFDDYVGKNPGSKSAVQALTGLGASIITAYGFKFLDNECDLSHKRGLSRDYRKECQESGITPDPKVIEDIFRSPRTSFAQVIFGQTTSNPVSYPGSRVLESLLDKTDD